MKTTFINRRDVYRTFPYLAWDDNNQYCYTRCTFDGWYEEVPDGWKELFLRMIFEIDNILHLDDSRLIVKDIYEKNGLLCFEYETDSVLEDDVNKIVKAYLKDSANICSNCGKPATCKTLSVWTKFYCNDCVGDNLYLKLKK